MTTIASTEIRLRRIRTTGHTLPADLHPVLQHIYLAREVSDQRQLAQQLDQMLSYQQLTGIDGAVTIIARHIQQQSGILIVGDYDADGATSCALAVRALRAMGAAQTGYLVPNRFEYGYGLTPEIVKVATERKPDLIITVDNGIASLQGVAEARAAGIEVVITDHHLPGSELPAADAIVNPNQPGDVFPSKHLAGVGVIFYVMVALRAWLRQQNWFEQQGIQEPNLAEYLDLVALGTVADVVQLDHNNRILVSQGLARIRAGKACAGIRALLQVAGRDARRVTSMDMGFFVGPRLNAAGRLDDMSIGIECLLSDDEDGALEMASLLDSFNRERRQIEQTMRDQAEQQLRRWQPDSAQPIPDAICLYDMAFHEGVIGILAGRIKEQLHRPTIVFAGSDEQFIKGSARSIVGLHMRDALDRIATQYPDLLQKFGGHAMAAGLTIKRDSLSRFQQIFTETVTALTDASVLQRVMLSDGDLDASDIDLTLAQLLRDAGPWGQGFPEPLFSGRFEVVQRRIVGEQHLKMRVKKQGKLFDAIAFRTTDADWPAHSTEVEMAYRLDVNEFNHQRQVQLIVEFIRPI